MNPLKFLEDFMGGLKKADVYQAQKETEYGQSVLDPRFKKEIKKEGVSVSQTPAQAAGAYTSRALIDIANDGTRGLYWRWNNPFAIGQGVTQAGIAGIKSPTAKAVAALAIGIPATAAAGTYDITNPEEEFRPKGYAQRYTEPGAEDRRISSQPAQEYFERFFLGRTGEPLKYATAKQEIPTLTPERYGNYLNYLYQDKGLLGIVKATPENLQGYPEARVLGFPVTLPMVGGYALGAAGAKIASSTGGTPRQRALRGIAGGAAGSLLGAAAGNVTNELIASANRPQLQTTAEYGVSTGKI